MGASTWLRTGGQLPRASRWDFRLPCGGLCWIAAGFPRIPEGLFGKPPVCNGVEKSGVSVPESHNSKLKHMGLGALARDSPEERRLAFVVAGGSGLPGDGFATGRGWRCRWAGGSGSQRWAAVGRREVPSKWVRRWNPGRCSWCRGRLGGGLGVARRGLSDCLAVGSWVETRLASLMAGGLGVAWKWVRRWAARRS